MVSATKAGPATQRLLSLDHEAATDPVVTGHKAATLARMRQSGHDVPAGVVLPAAMVTSLHSGSGARDLPPDVRDGLEAVLHEFGVVAVRSSGLAEDLPDASWAGQYDSVLGVSSTSALWTAIDSCAASARSARAASYGHETRTDPSSIAILVQRQVDAGAAGVAFSANPVTGDDEVLVSAVRGLGDRLVSGEATPEDWVVRPGVAPVRLGGPEHVLDSADAARIASLATNLAAEIGTPADVEWAIEQGALHLLQVRPITALPVKPQLNLPTKGTWLKDTSHYTGPLTPIGATLYIPHVAQAIGELAATYGLLIDGIEMRTVGGECYTKPIPPGGKDGSPPPWWLMGVLLRIVPPLRAKARTAKSALDEDLPGQTLRKWRSSWQPELEERIAALRAVDLTSLDDAALRAHLDRVLALSADGQRIHFLLVMPYLMALNDLVTQVGEAVGWNESEAIELVGGLSTASSAPTRDLLSLAGLAQRDPAVRELMAGWAGQPLDAFLAALRSLGGNELAAGIDAHLVRFGCRTTGYDPGEPSIAERPALVLGILRDFVQEGASPDRLDAQLTQRRAAAGERLDQALAERGTSASDRARLLDALERARATWPVREENLFYTDSMPSGLLRLMVLEVGRRLTAAGSLRRREDASWLTGDELFAAAEGRFDQLRDLGANVARRKAERAWTAAHPGPAVIGPPPSAPPDLRAAPEAVRRTTGALLWFMGHEFPGERAPGNDLRGTPGAPGQYTGSVRIVRSDAEFVNVQTGDVLVCPITTPVWSVLFGRVGALVTDAGGVLSHAAIIAREHNIPAVLGTVNATTRLRDGQIVTVDGTTGVVQIHDEPGAMPDKHRL